MYLASFESKFIYGRLKLFFSSDSVNWFEASVSLAFDPTDDLNSGSASGEGGLVVYQYPRKKLAKIPKNTQNSSNYTQNYTQVYFIPDIQRK